MVRGSPLPEKPRAAQPVCSEENLRSERRPGRVSRLFQIWTPTPPRPYAKACLSAGLKLAVDERAIPGRRCGREFVGEHEHHSAVLAPLELADFPTL
jgi:hypothetical protein